MTPHDTVLRRDVKVTDHAGVLGRSPWEEAEGGEVRAAWVLPEGLTLEVRALWPRLAGPPVRYTRSAGLVGRESGVMGCSD